MVKLRLLLPDPLLDGLALVHLRDGVAEALGHRPPLGCGVTLVEHIVHAAVDQGVPLLQLVELLSFLGNLDVEVDDVFHELILPPLHLHDVHHA